MLHSLYIDDACVISLCLFFLSPLFVFRFFRYIMSLLLFFFSEEGIDDISDNSGIVIYFDSNVHSEMCGL